MTSSMPATPCFCHGCGISKAEAKKLIAIGNTMLCDECLINGTSVVFEDTPRVGPYIGLILEKLFALRFAIPKVVEVGLRSLAQSLGLKVKEEDEALEHPGG